MKSVSSKIYTKKYYLGQNLGFEEFNKHKGKIVNNTIREFANLINPKKNSKILDIGCGRGDLDFELARLGANVMGIDYSEAGIKIAKNAIKYQAEEVKKRVDFKLMNAKKLKFADNFFDIVVTSDVFEHLFKEELEIAMEEIKRVMKPDGLLIVHTAPNKIYLDYTHKYWVYPVDKLFIMLNKLFTGNIYPGVNKESRNNIHKKQHVNEPTIFYLKTLFKKNYFSGNIISKVPYKPFISWKDYVYNVFVYLYPISKMSILKIFFATDYICIQKIKK